MKQNQNILHYKAMENSNQNKAIAFYMINQV